MKKLNKFCGIFAEKILKQQFLMFFHRIIK